MHLGGPEEAVGVRVVSLHRLALGTELRTPERHQHTASKSSLQPQNGFLKVGYSMDGKAHRGSAVVSFISHLEHSFELLL